MKIDFMTPVRLALIIMFILASRGTPLFWLGLFIIAKEVKFWISLRK